MTINQKSRWSLVGLEVKDWLPKPLEGIEMTDRREDVRHMYVKEEHIV